MTLGIALQQLQGRCRLTKWVDARILVCAGFLFLVLGCRLWLIHAIGSQTPYMDEWDGEAAYLLKPFLEGRLHLTDLFAPHNEHVIFFTKIVTLAVYKLAGYWDVVLQMVINAAAWSLILSLTFAALARGLAYPRYLIAAIACAFVATIPFAWENILLGFQTQFWALIGLSVASLVCLSPAAAWSFRWWSGATLAAASFATMASGALTPAAGAAICFLQLLAGCRSGWREWAAALALAAETVVLVLLVPSLPGSAWLRATDLGDLAQALLQLLSFPSSVHWGWLAFVPAFGLLISMFAQRRPISDPAWLNSAMLCWLLAQYTTIAYGRARFPLASRYADMFQLGIIINIVAAQHLAPSGPLHAPLRWLRPILLSAWLVFMAVSVGFQAVRTLPAILADRQHQGEAQVTNIRRYLSTSDAAAFAGKSPNEISYPDTDRLRMLLDDPTIRGILPSSLLLRDERAPTGTERLKRGVLAWHFLFTGVGVVLFLFAAFPFRRTQRLITESVPVRPLEK